MPTDCQGSFGLISEPNTIRLRPATVIALQSMTFNEVHPLEHPYIGQPAISQSVHHDERT